MSWTGPFGSDELTSAQLNEQSVKHEAYTSTPRFPKLPLGQMKVWHNQDRIYILIGQGLAPSDESPLVLLFPHNTASAQPAPIKLGSTADAGAAGNHTHPQGAS